MNTALANYIETLLGRIITEELTAEQGCTSEVRSLVTEEGSFILKSATKDKYRVWLREEALVLEQLNREPLTQEQRVSVPKFHGFFEEQNGSHLLMSKEEGVTLTVALQEATSIPERQRLLRSFGNFLHRFHERVPDAALEHGQDWLESQLARARRYVEMGQTGAGMELLEQLESGRPDPVQKAMIHGDCTTDNVFVQDGEVKLIIDVAGMTVGDSRYDVALAIREFADCPELLEAFFGGYTRCRLSQEELQYFDKGLYEFF
ncbi:phosphotransferase [Paenibacillus tengchongensis]|uniref:phosphotransferase n=1 Tax=Paenibacillus tengchongensis TaxID=2608684 RepID=UPI00124D74D6|nr:phosphotransferase [Paenibacillus tengchongensis]